MQCLLDRGHRAWLCYVTTYSLLQKDGKTLVIVMVKCVELDQALAKRVVLCLAPLRAQLVRGLGLGECRFWPNEWVQQGGAIAGWR